MKSQIKLHNKSTSRIIHDYSIYLDRILSHSIQLDGLISSAYISSWKIFLTRLYLRYEKSPNTKGFETLAKKKNHFTTTEPRSRIDRSKAQVEVQCNEVVLHTRFQLDNRKL